MTTPLFTLRVNFSHEDKAAKGLRSLREPAAAPQPPVYFTAREMANANPHLLLLGERGSGKTVFARQLAEATGDHYLGITGPETLQAGPSLAPDQRLILDGIDRLGLNGQALLANFLASLGNRPFLLLGDGAVVKGWLLPPGTQVHSLLPLSLDERSQSTTSRAALAPAAANPALFTLALTMDEPIDTAEQLIDVWVDEQRDVAESGFEAVRDGTSVNRAVDDLLAGRHMLTLDPAEIAALFLGDPQRWKLAIASFLRRAPDTLDTLASLLVTGENDAALRGALLVAAGLSNISPARPAIAVKLLQLIQTGRLSPHDRDQAARHLALWGDPRDLEAFCEIPGGSFTMGSNTNPNSQPVATVTVAPFRIGRYPVTNALYARFVAAIGRAWVSPEAHMPERANAPATDLTWRDARAFCDWLTAQWRITGRIGPNDIVRLPTEPEWERAARGDQPDSPEIVYPWGRGWNPDATNSEETGFNAPCAVGLFPAGISPYGCYDMAGQIWEWTTTLWGDDMASPSFAYPYRNDGREDPDPGPNIRRVLRGGCFSSTSLKACCTYRGSLEPDGFWRGNGFRIVIA